MLKHLFNLTALALEVTAAYLAAPIAMKAFGDAAGIVLTIGIALSIFGTWAVAFNHSKLSKLARSALACAALILLTISSFAVHTSASTAEQRTKAEQKTKALEKVDADYERALATYTQQLEANQANYDRQEQMRIASLTQINNEIKATVKTKQPDIYEQLLARQKELSAPTPKPVVLDKPVKTTPLPDEPTSQADVLSIIQSAAFGALVPFLLMLGAITPNTSSDRVSVRKLITKRTPLITSDQVISSSQSTGLDSALNASQDPFEARLVPTNSEGRVTLESVINYFKISERQARYKRDNAHVKGYLERRSNAYYYPSKSVDVVKNNDASNIVSIKQAKRTTRVTKKGKAA